MENIYETSDLTEHDQHAAEEKAEKFESEHIESIQLDIGAAYQRFKGRTLNTDDVDFSDSSAPRRRKGYGGASYVLELIGSSEKPETVEQRFNRLQQEIIELSGDAKKIEDECEKTGKKEQVSVSASDIAGLQQQLKRVQLEQVLGRSALHTFSDPALLQTLKHSLEKAKEKAAGDSKKPANSDQVTYELFLQSSDTKTTRLAELESRLSRLDKLVGSYSEKLRDGEGGRGVVEMVEGLWSRLDLLDQSQVEAVEARLAMLLHKLNQIAEKKQELEDGEWGRVNELYELMKQWDGFCGALPDLLARMQALSHLHEQALQFSQCLTQLDAVQQELSKTLETDGKLLNELRTGLAKNMDGIEKNCHSLDKRLKALSK